MPDFAVYRFTWPDDESGENKVNPRFATLKAIKMCNGRSIEATRRIVDAKEIDGNGYLKPAKA